MKGKKVRIATLGIAEELRNMNIGDVVQFPLDKYNYNSIRSTPATTLVAEKIGGKNWKTRVNYEDKCVEATRIS